MQIDELISPRWIAPVEPEGALFEGFSIAVKAGKILDIVATEQARSLYSPARMTDLPNHLVTPGLINLHTHAAMCLLRGIGDDLPLDRWLRDRIWPVEQELVSYDFVRDGSKLACLEMLRGGTTCFNDMYFFPDAAAEAALQTGIRASLGITVMDLPTAWGTDASDYLARGLALRDTLQGEPRITFCLAPHAPYTVRDQTFDEIRILSDQLESPIHLHVHETAQEIVDGIAAYGVRPIERLDRLGLVHSNLIAVHAVHLNLAELDLFAIRGVSVAHCPASNLKLGSGIAPVAEMLGRGIRVGIGTDGAASNNRLDMLGELRLAALLAKGASGKAEAFDAQALLASGTLCAAKALGIDDRIGSIVKGKDADLVAFDLAGLDLQPIYDPLSHLFFVAGREHVTDVWVAGDAVVRKRQIVGKGAREAETEGATALSLWQNRVKIRNDSLR